MTDLRDLEQRFQRAVAAFPPPARRHLLRILVAPAGERAREIGRLHQEGRFRGLTELLIDLEEEPAARALVLGELRRLGRNDQDRRRP